MAATMEERLDEMLAMSREAGRLACELALWDKNPRFMAKTRKDHDALVKRLANLRKRFLAEMS